MEMVSMSSGCDAPAVHVRSEPRPRRETVQSGVSLLILLATLLYGAVALAVPDEDLLGKAEGYPICPPSVRPETRCLVSLVSRFDEVLPARKVAKGIAVRLLTRAAAEPV